MRVVFDHQAFLGQQYGARSRSVVELARRLAQGDEFDVRIVAPAHQNIHLAQAKLGVGGWKVPISGTIGRAITWAGQKMVPFSMRRAKAGIVHETGFSDKASAPDAPAVVITVNDLAPERFPDAPGNDRALLARRLAAISRADHILCPTRRSRADLLEFYDLDPSTVTVAMPGGLTGAIVLPEQMAARQDAAPVILHVGRRSGHRNFTGLIEAVGLSAPLRQARATIVAFGGGPLTAEEKAAAKNAGLDDDRLVATHGDDSVLLEHYRLASVLALPSFYEGFSMAAQEAMGAGCPIVCSNQGGFPEQLGNAAVYCDPYDTDSIRQALEDAIEPGDAHTARLHHGLALARAASWDAYAQGVLQAYRKLAGTDPAAGMAF